MATVRGRLALVSAVLLCTGAHARRPRKPAGPPPDLTKGAEVDGKKGWNLGPTGCRGWIFVKSTGKTVGSLTGDARQILITKIDKGSPADGVLEIGDVILGTGGRRFAEDARKCFGRAITEAESERNRGVLRLIVWRKGREREVRLKLKVMGTYSDTSPWNCPKSKRILEDGCRYIAAQKWGRFSIEALALMASGKEEYASLVQEHVRKTLKPDLKLSVASGGKVSWGWGYQNLLLTEYYLLTGDKAVLPNIAAYANGIGRGQSWVGTWGHGMAWTSLNDGRLHGSAPGYGALNQAGIICHLSMVLAKKCGVEDSEVDSAVERANTFFAHYINKGTVPYGDHRPGLGVHDDNGKNSSTALVFALQGHREGTRFFSKMVTASSEDREWGHTGNCFSYLWAAPAANCGGPKAAAAFLKELRWYYDLARRWDGSFTYQPVGGGNGGKYYGISSTGAYMLAYALPEKKLCITGRDAHRENWLSAAEVKEAVEAGRGGEAAYKGKSAEELFEALGSWSPAVRTWAAQALARQKGDFVPRLVRMVQGRDRHARIGACQALEYLKGRSASAVPVLTKLLTHEDVWLRIRACYALMRVGAPARGAVPEMLRLAARKPRDDPRNFTQRALAFCLFYPGGALGMKGLIADSLEGLDKDLLYTAIREVMKSDDGRARGCMRSVFKRLTLEDIIALGPDILRAIEEKSPSGVMFAKGVRIAGVQMLAKHRIEEGMRLCIVAMGLGQWGQGYQTGVCLGILKTYGTAARAILPELKELTRNKDLLRFKDNHAKLVKLIAAIEGGGDPPKLISLRKLRSDRGLD